MTKCYIKDYPRPQFVRKDWVNLNGSWDFSFEMPSCGTIKKDMIEQDLPQKIVISYDEII